MAIDDPMPEVALDAVLRKREKDKLKSSNNTRDERLSGIEWLRNRLTIKHHSCSKHYHAECHNCGAVKCCSENGYSKYESVTLACDCKRENSVDHTVVPFTTFGEHVGFPR